MSSTATLSRPAPARAGRRDRLVAALRTSPGLFRLGLAAIALHVVDDTLVQPPSGTSPGDNLAGALVPLAVLAVAAWAYPRLSGVGRGMLALLSGVAGGVAAVEAVHYTTTVGASGDDYTGWLAIPAAVLLLGLGAVGLWRTRRTDGTRPRRYARRALCGVGALLGLLVVVYPTALGYIITHTGRSVVPADRLGVPHETVSFTTGDGLTLHGWYVPSRNRAAVIAFPGRNGSQDKARMLARHGYGVLLFDRRGEGLSDGKPNAAGWGGEEDVKSAITWLRRRADVDPNRIGGIGLSVGGEMLIEAAAEDRRLRAVVSDGAGARSIREDLHRDADGIVDRVLGTAMSAIKTASVAVSSSQAPPPDLVDLARRVGPTPLLLIAAPNSPNGERLNRPYARAAGETAELWEIPEASHVGGQSARPAAYERRVVGFFDAALAPRGGGR